MNEKQHDIYFIKDALHHYYSLRQMGFIHGYACDIYNHISDKSYEMGLEITANDVVVKRGDDET